MLFHCPNFCPRIRGFLMADYSTKKVTQSLIEELKQALKSVKGWGSVEVIVQENKVTQITVRNIKKTSHSVLTI